MRFEITKKLIDQIATLIQQQDDKAILAIWKMFISLILLKF